MTRQRQEATLHADSAVTSGRRSGVAAAAAAAAAATSCNQPQQQRHPRRAGRRTVVIEVELPEGVPDRRQPARNALPAAAPPTGLRDALRPQQLRQRTEGHRAVRNRNERQRRTVLPVHARPASAAQPAAAPPVGPSELARRRTARPVWPAWAPRAAAAASEESPGHLPGMSHGPELLSTINPDCLQGCRTQNGDTDTRRQRPRVVHVWEPGTLDGRMLPTCRVDGPPWPSPAMAADGAARRTSSYGTARLGRRSL